MRMLLSLIFFAWQALAVIAGEVTSAYTPFDLEKCQQTEPPDDHPRVAYDVTRRIALVPFDEPGALQAAIDADGAIPQRTPHEVRGRGHRLAIE